MTRKCKRKALSFPTLTGRGMPKRLQDLAPAGFIFMSGARIQAPARSTSFLSFPRGISTTYWLCSELCL